MSENNTDNCALDANGHLKDPKDIPFYFSPSHSQPLPTVGTAPRTEPSSPTLAVSGRIGKQLSQQKLTARKVVQKRKDAPALSKQPRVPHPSEAEPTNGSTAPEGALLGDSDGEDAEDTKKDGKRGSNVQIVADILTFATRLDDGTFRCDICV